MISFDPVNKQIKNLSPSIATSLNSVLTCAHALSIEEGRAKTYFVPTGQIDLTTGYPVGVNSVNGNGGLIHFLENDHNAYPIDRLHIKNITLNQWREYDLDMGQPQFFENEDLVIGEINITNRNQAVYNINYAVSFLQIPINNESKYFATGYPGCDHYSLEPFNHFNMSEA